MTAPPRFLRTVGRHRANDCSFTLSYNRGDISAEFFGAIAPNWCLKCGPVWEDLHEVCLFRGSYWQPPDYSMRCPSCGREDCWEHTSPQKALAVVRRYRAPRLTRNDLNELHAEANRVDEERRYMESA